MKPSIEEIEFHGIAALRPMHCNPANVGPAHRAGFRMRTGRQHINERLVRIARFIKRLYVEILVQLRIQRRVNATDQRGQMRHESQADLVTGCGDV